MVSERNQGQASDYKTERQKMRGKHFQIRTAAVARCPATPYDLYRLLLLLLLLLLLTLSQGVNFLRRFLLSLARVEEDWS